MQEIILLNCHPVLDAFLFPDDDPRVIEARNAMVGKRSRLDVDWQRCETRHGQVREKEGLGQKRPLTNWEAGSSTHLMDHCWMEFGSAQVDRVLDLMDINYLRRALKDSEWMSQSHDSSHELANGPLLLRIIIYKTLVLL